MKPTFSTPCRQRSRDSAASTCSSTTPEAWCTPARCTKRPMRSGTVTDVFLKGVFRFSRAVIPHMQRQGGGSIVNIGSVLGLKAALAFPVHPYAVAKAGVAMLTKTIAVHYAKDGIRCNCVAPAVSETPLLESRLTDPAVRKAMEGAPSRVGRRRMDDRGDPDGRRRNHGAVDARLAGQDAGLSFYVTV